MGSHDLIICFITDDSALDHLFQTLSFSYNIQLLSMGSIQEALEQIPKIPFDGCIIDSAISNNEKINSYFEHKEMVVRIKKPIDATEVHQVFTKLLQSWAPLKPPPLDPKMQKHYTETIPKKLGELKTLIDAIHTTISMDTLTNLRLAVHKIAGSAGTYGYWRVSQLCKKLELDLLSKINQGSSISDLNLDLFLKQIQEGFKWQSQKNG